MARVLIIDDEEDIRDMLRNMLEDAGHVVVDAPSGDVGMQILREEPADLIITDIFMPEKEGLDTIIELRHDFPEVKIIAISGGGTMEWGKVPTMDFLDVAKRFGAQRTFMKPFKLHEIQEAVDELLMKDG